MPSLREHTELIFALSTVGFGCENVVVGPPRSLLALPPRRACSQGRNRERHAQTVNGLTPARRRAPSALKGLERGLGRPETRPYWGGKVGRARAARRHLTSPLVGDRQDRV
eukprot:scaffold2591_cov417-Prasinococcus_capsulatus_cf.AAC.2